jgi:hypothetical protein
MKIKYIVFLLISSIMLYACQPGSSSSPEQASDAMPEAPLAEDLDDAQPESPTSPTQEIQEPQVPQEDVAETESEPAPQLGNRNPCDHPFFPIDEGAFWTYQEPDTEGYTIRIEDTSDDQFRMIQEIHSEDAVYAVDWFCTGDGIMRGTFGQMEEILNDSEDEEEDAPEFQFETLEWEGETLPSPELIAQGYSWISDYKMRAIVGDDPASLEITVKVNHVIAATEEVTVPVGTFPEAIRVDSSGSIEMVMLMGEMTTQLPNVSFTYSTWYVEGVGMVKINNTYMGETLSTELVETSYFD